MISNATKPNQTTRGDDVVLFIIDSRESEIGGDREMQEGHRRHTRPLLQLAEENY